MDESGKKAQSTHRLTPARPLIHRCGGPPSPWGKVKERRDYICSFRVRRNSVQMHSLSEKK